ncbi:MAG: zinc metallopeptidase [bacterium]|nr:zinc metallopeptidase [bacterium]
MFFDSTMLLLVPVMIFAFWAQSRVKSTFAKFSKVQASSGMTGEDLAVRLLRDGGLGDVKVEHVAGELSDHYDPRSRVLRLSDSTHASRSVAALGVTAHEVGHAIQHKEAFASFQLRQSIVPVANIGSTLAFPLFLIGMFMGHGGKFLMDLGILMYVGAVAFTVVTLPVEFNASSRALALLSNRGYLVQSETDQARQVLRAAAMTYVAATAMAVVQLLRLLVLRGQRD